MNAKRNRRKSSKIDEESSPSNENPYSRRLRSWNQKSKVSLTTEPTTDSSTKSTVYSYSIRRSDLDSIGKSNSQCSQSFASQCAFYAPSISYRSMKPVDQLNNNNMETFNIAEKLSKLSSPTVSCDSIPSRWSRADSKLNFGGDRTLQKCLSIDRNFDLNGSHSLSKRSRLSNEHFSHFDHRSNPSNSDLDSCTIDINQSKQQLTVRSARVHSSSMEKAVKMVQPIVDIIFNAVEDQLKTNALKLRNTVDPQTTLVPYSPPTSITLPFCSSRAPPRPVTLHSVHFNVQLNPEQTQQNIFEVDKTNDSYSTSTEHSVAVCFSELKQKLVESFLVRTQFDDWLSFSRELNNNPLFQRLLQWIIISLSVLCGYWFL